MISQVASEVNYTCDLQHRSYGKNQIKKFTKMSFRVYQGLKI